MSYLKADRIGEMSSTLGVLDVLSRLREEFERASTALVAQEVVL